MSESLNILLCEPDNAEGARLIAHLGSHGADGEVTMLTKAAKIPAALANRRWDLVLCAHAAPAFDARQILDIVRAADPDLPVIVLASDITEAEAAALIIAGGRDVMRKSDLSRLVPIVLREIESSRTRHDLVQAQGRAEVHFRNIVESSLQGIMVRANARTQFVNPAFCRMFGYTEAELMELTSTAPLHPASEQDVILNRIKRRYEGDLSVRMQEVQGIRKDGTLFWCDKMTSVIDWNGQSAALIAVLDITERKNAEQQLAESERQYRETFENAPVALMRANYAGKIVEANIAFSNMLGYPAQEIIGRRVGDFVPDDDNNEVIPAIRRVWTREIDGLDTEHRMVRKDGSRIWVHSSSRLMPDSGAEIEAREMLAQFQDVTRRHEAEVALQERETLYRNLVEKSLQGIVIIDHSGKALFVNNVFAEILGYTPDEIMAMDVMFPLYPEEDRNRLRRRMTSRQAGDQATTRYEIRAIKKDGTTVWLEQLSAGVEWNGQSAIQVAVIDITDRKKNALLLEARELKYRQTFENAPVAMFRIDRNRQLHDVNRAFVDMVGYTLEDLQGTPAYNLIHPDDAPNVRKRTMWVWNGRVERIENEYRLICKNGDQIWVTTSGRLTPDENGELNHLIVQLQDVTARKTAEEQLQLARDSLAISEKQYREMFDNAPVAMMVIDREHTIQAVNQAFIDLVGYNKDDLNGVAAHTLVHPDDAPNVRKRTASVRSGDIERVENEYRINCKDGRQIWVSTSGRMTPDKSGGKSHLIVQMQDVTARKNAEEQLRLAKDSLAISEKQYRDLFNNAPVGLCWVSTDGDYVRTNRAVQDMLGYTEDELLKMRPLESVHPDFREGAEKGMMALRSGKTDRSTNETVHIRKDGSEIWVSVTVNLLRDENGQPQHILAQLQDITARKQAETQLDEARRSLERREQQYRALFEYAPVAMLSVSLDGKFLQTNQAYRDLLGYSEDEIMRMRPIDTVHPDQRDSVEKGMSQPAVTFTPHRFSHDRQLVRKDGTPIWVWLSGTRIGEEQGNPGYMLTHLQDITARKKAEAQLFQSQKMEALGNLAGGIAHDFNNMLLPIIGLTALTKEDLPADSPIQENLDMVIEAAENARRIVSQILTFSRQDQAAAAAIDISLCVGEAVELVRNILPSSITVVDEVKPDVGTILADAAQLHSVILNLGSNAVHAMDGKVGSLAIGLEKLVADPALAESVHGLHSGTPYARIHVRDTGCGMDKETLAKIFNPFFTTKPVGEGTGLGLSMVHGIIERFGGGIHVSSEVGIGTQFDIYLPLQAAETSAHAGDAMLALA